MMTSVTRSLCILAAVGTLMLGSGCQEISEPAPESQNGDRSDPGNTTYTIEGSPVTLIDGVAKAPAAHGSSSKVVARIWGEPTVADLQQDGIDDAVLLLAQSTGGSGTFYYLVAAIGSPEGSSGTAGLLLGDRIDPQAIDVRDGRISVRYLTRGVGESFADSATVEVQRDFLYTAESRRLVEVAHDFEGEADPDRMTLGMKTWTWIETVYNNDTVKHPAQPEAFTLTFREEIVQGTTDCNSFHGPYSVNDREILFDEKIAATRMFCAEAQETEFLQMLQHVHSYFFTSKGELILELKYDSGVMVFR